MKMTVLLAIMLSAAIACADDSGNDKLQARIDNLKQQRTNLLTTVNNAESYSDASARYQQADVIQRRIDKLSALQNHTFEPSNTHRNVVISDVPSREVDYSYLQNSGVPAKTSRPITDTSVDQSDPTDKYLRKLKKMGHISAELENDLVIPLPSQTKDEAGYKREKKRSKIKSKLDD